MLWNEKYDFVNWSSFQPLIFIFEEIFLLWQEPQTIAREESDLEKIQINLFLCICKSVSMGVYVDKYAIKISLMAILATDLQQSLCEIYIAHTHPYRCKHMCLYVYKYMCVCQLGRNNA